MKKIGKIILLVATTGLLGVLMAQAVLELKLGT
jgi:hypothetical protein